MVSNGKQKLNRKDVRQATLRFILSFVVLCTVSFLTVFFMFKSSRIQQEHIQIEIDAYKNMISRNEVMRTKLDEIYDQMNLMNSNKVQNEILLRDRILEDIRNTESALREDSAKGLKHYAVFLKHSKEIMRFKNELLNIRIQEQSALRNLNDCMGTEQRMTDRLKPDVPKISKKFKGR
ncbi:type VI secretion system TssO [Chryseobacterium sp. MFBS3-17]|uniref:type VI secretion system TssO n=1 Tax=Chryseobacterium sp. MFBS3-17 TaxID=2886689 RepID=UPI001D0E9FD5|nr:type VI secretion system TssO [Chryseobacterium sp. MFBS3-17]MCC2590644.1 type VI secretion system transmembrane protein TssO [Chryseobacterium sp. MFBS3-17]